MGFETKAWLVLPLLFLLANCLQKCVTGKSQVPCLFIFGDSLSDSGNNNDLPTTAKSNYNPYGIDFPTGPTGRFTNGRTTIDIITQLLGFEDFIPPFANTSGSDILKGVNYASGSAGIRNETGTRLGRLGCTPKAIYTTGSGSCAEEENAAAVIFNAKLKSLVELFNNKLSTISKFIFINSTSIDQENSLGNSFGFLIIYVTSIHISTLKTIGCHNTYSHGMDDLSLRYFGD